MKKLILFLIPCVVIGLMSCNKNSSAGGNSSMSVYMTDGPAAYDKLYIDVKSIQVKSSTDASENDWINIPLARPGIYNLLDLKNGIDTLMGTLQLPAGHISQLRLILGLNNSVVINGISYPLTTPSAQQSGLKLAINADLLDGINYKIWIDFDAARSVVQTGSGSYILKPVIRTFTAAETGAIAGIVLPVNAMGWVFAITNATDTLTSTPANQLTGAFLLRGIPAASYKVAFHATAGTYKDTVYNNITVINGTVNNVGTVTLR